MIQTFGADCEGEPEAIEPLHLTFSPTSLAFEQRWKNTGLMADFLADYMDAFGLAPPASRAKLGSLHDMVRYIANELLENATKYQHDSLGRPISLRVKLAPNCLSIITDNFVTPDQAERYRNFIADLLASDALEMFVRRVESDPPTGGSAGLGFLTMMTAYSATIGWRFESVPDEPTVIMVATAVQVTI